MQSSLYKKSYGKSAFEKQRLRGLIFFGDIFLILNELLWHQTLMKSLEKESQVVDIESNLTLPSAEFESTASRILPPFLVPAHWNEWENWKAFILETQIQYSIHSVKSCLTWDFGSVTYFPYQVGFRKFLWLPFICLQTSEKMWKAWVWSQIYVWNRCDFIKRIFHHQVRLNEKRMNSYWLLSWFC